MHGGLEHLYDVKCKKSQKANTLDWISRLLNVDIPLFRKYILGLQVQIVLELRKRLM